MTCFEKYILEHQLPIIGCPADYKYASIPKDCYLISCFKDCWSRELEENIKEDD